MGRIELTEQDLIAALTAAQVGATDEGGGVSVFELALLTGHCERWVREKLKLLAHQGRVEVSHRPGRMLDGRPMSLPVYRLKDRE